MLSPSHWQRLVSGVIDRPGSCFLDSRAGCPRTRDTLDGAGGEMFPRKQFAPFGFDARAVRPREDEQPVVGTREPVAALVHEPVMKAAQRDEIGELRLAAVGPVLDVMAFREAGAIAARDNGNRRRALSAPG